MRKPIITIEDLSGGASLSPVGSRNQFMRGDYVDAFSSRRMITQTPAFTSVQYSGSTDINANIYSMVSTVTDGGCYFGATSGKIFKLSIATDIGLEHTSSQTGTVVSMKEYNGYLYFAQDATLGRYDLSSTWTDSWQSSNIQSSTYKPMEVSSDNNLYIGNGRYVAKWDGTTFSYNALDLASGWQVRCLTNFGIGYIAIGANFENAGTSTACKVLLWDRLSSSWNTEIEIPESKILAMYYKAGYLWVLAGTNPTIYVISVGSSYATKVYSFYNKDIAQPAEVFPNAIAYNSGRIWFGISSLSSNSVPYTPAAVYSIDANPQRFNINTERIISTSTGGVTITSLATLNTTHAASSAPVFYAYDLGSAEGLAIQYYTTTPYGNSYFETLEYRAPYGKKIYIDGFGADFVELLQNQSIKIEYSTDGGVTYTSPSNLDSVGTTGMYTFWKPCVIETYKIIIKVTYGGGTTTKPVQIKRVYATGEIIDDTR